MSCPLPDSILVKVVQARHVIPRPRLRHMARQIDSSSMSHIRAYIQAVCLSVCMSVCLSLSMSPREAEPENHMIPSKPPLSVDRHVRATITFLIWSPLCNREQRTIIVFYVEFFPNQLSLPSFNRFSRLSV